MNRERPGSGPAATPPVVAAQDLVLHNAPLMEQLEAAARRVLRSGRFILDNSPSSEAQAFETEAAKELGTEHAVGVSSGTDALLALLMAHGVGPGDEVVTTPFSFVASAASIARLGARVVFAEVNPATLTLCPEAAIKKFTSRTKAVLTVHLFGRVAGCQALESACRSRNIPLLEDAAQAIGARDERGRRVGTIGAAAALSFFPSKNLGGFGDGGMVLTNDRTLAASIRQLRTQGASRKFHHPILGGNFRLDEIQAALLRVKLPYLEGWLAARRRLAELYRSSLVHLPIILPPPDAGSAWNQFVIQVPGGAAGAAAREPGEQRGGREHEGRSAARDALAAHLQEQRVGISVYYPEPLHLQPCFAALGHQQGDFPVAERAADEVLALPLYPELTDQQVRQVVTAIEGFFQQRTTGRAGGAGAPRLDSARAQK